ncbi:MAG: hypothetical protein ACYDAO_04450 [Thermoplasmataceae archaeon]
MIEEQTLNGHKKMRNVRISVHNWKHLKYLREIVPSCKTLDDAIDILLEKAKKNWDCMDNPDFKKIVGDVE